MDQSHRPQPGITPARALRLHAVLVFAGAADADGVQPLLHALQERGAHALAVDGNVLALFERPVHAVAAALALQRAARASGSGTPALRAGIHVGDVSVATSAATAAAPAALQVDSHSPACVTATRLAELARPGQVLLSGIAQALVLRARDELDAAGLRWRRHGRWRFTDTATRLSVHEIGVAGIAPLKRPPTTAAARQERRWFQRRGVRIAGGLLGLAAAAGGLQAMLGSSASPEFARRDWVVVADLQNLTDDPRYDVALRGALRTGLEGSRHVNVVPEVRVDESLQRMQRPTDTRLDRNTAIEVALREGARLVLLPTVAVIGEQVRVSIQAVDPGTGMAVTSVSADGSGADGALVALDEALSALREELGESLAGIASSATPLERVTSPDLEALRAYSLGVRAAEQGEPLQASALFGRALELDPGFAAAHARLAAYSLQTGDRAGAWRHVEAAHANRERLGTRDRLYVDGYRAFFGTPREMLARWNEYATRYPDAAVAHHNLGYVHLVFGNDFANAALHLERAASDPHSPIGSSMELLASTLLAQGRVGEAERWIEQRRGLPRAPVFHADVDLAIARRELERAHELLRDRNAGSYQAAVIAHALRRAVVAVERGDPQPARQALAWLQAGLDEQRAAEAQARAELAQLAIEAWVGPVLLEAPLQALVEREAARLQRAAQSRDYSAVNHLLIAAVLAARSGHDALADAAIGHALPHAQDSGFPDREAWLAAARAERALLAGQPDAALEAIRPALAIDLYYAHVLTLRARLASGALDAAIAEAEWLEAHRGQMLGEFVALQAALLLNVTATSEALLAVAAAAAASGEPRSARRLLAPLSTAWQDGDAAAAEPVRRARALAAQLGPGAAP